MTYKTNVVELLQEEITTFEGSQWAREVELQEAAKAMEEQCVARLSAVYAEASSSENFSRFLKLLDRAKETLFLRLTARKQPEPPEAHTPSSRLLVEVASGSESSEFWFQFLQRFLAEGMGGRDNTQQSSLPTSPWKRIRRALPFELFTTSLLAASVSATGPVVPMASGLDDSLQDVRRALHKVLEEESHLLMTQLRGEIAAELRALHSRELANFGLQLRHMLSEVPTHAPAEKPTHSEEALGANKLSPPDLELQAQSSKSPDLCIATESDSQGTASTASTTVKEVVQRDESTGEVPVTAKMSCVPDSCTVGLVNHELRSPLNGLAGYARTLAETDAKYQKEFRLFTNTAQFALENVTNLIDLWTYAGKQISDLVSVGVSIEDINDLTEERLSRSTTRKGKPLLKSAVALEMTVEDPSLAMTGDYTALTVMHFHLVANSIKFTERGKVSATWRRTEEGLCLSVRDTGIGIATKSMDRIFEPFDVEDKSESRKHEGIGLGLAAAR
ncbi:barA [Symbiodinium natans]|uniref:histidine kinase n=1 Tax=Symbiodinium natans TaxID=878477 RepID=A0A812NN68_9DINO|nr:barA [Symbiodinium natans]